GRSGAYQVYLAETAAQAQEYLVKQEFSLIVLDLVLPDRDGREILREIKYDFKLATPVLVLSAITRDEVRIECMSLGAEKFFTKPFAADELAEKVEDLLGKSTKPELSLVPLDGETQEEPVTAAKAQNPELLGKSVLVAEDDSMQANLIRQRLLKEGLEVKHAENGQLALDALHHKQFSLIILDVNMPVIDGFDVLKQIRKEPVTRDIPVIMLTAMGSENDIIRGYDLGANDYILKPFSPVQLLARVKSLLKKKDTVPLSR
ncbi:MAG: response regulator, partial [Pseudohongiellaceae bacterium]